ncbi:MAG TPA: hypothetical protein VFH68_02715 [Polyangia bacterium]|nr:hypothetical protein [Polyangia bacterium]
MNMKRRLQLLGFVVLTAVGLGGCTATVSGEAYGPELAYVAPGVQVIADYNEPIFYTDGYYWRSSGNTWYRSRYYNRGWAYAPPPPAIVRIDRPYAYAHYRPRGGPGYVARPAAPPPGRAGWRGSYAASPPPPAASGWRGSPPQAARPLAPSRGSVAAPAPARPAPQQQGRPAPKRQGWR